MNKMSEDEELYHNEEKIIDVLENVFIFKDTYDKFTKLDLECIHDLVHLYKQEKEKNKQLEEKQNRLAFKTNQYMNDVLSNNIISKDKIRAKIEEINNRRIEDGQCELALHGFQREAKIDILKELLEEN